MSIRIEKDKCIGCLKCMTVCPGSLIYKNKEGKAYIKYEKNCWGCAACVKECANGAIKYYLGADIGGSGSYLYISKRGDHLKWRVINKDDIEIIISTNRKESNKY